MSEWWTYRLSDFLLFSADTYYRLFELYNTAIWPAHIVVLVLSGLWFYFLIRPKPWSGKLLFTFLGTTWLWIAWGYHVSHFTSVNWAASYYAIGFALEGLLLILAGGSGKARPIPFNTHWTSRVGAGLIGFSLILQPLITPLSGRPWTQVELFALAPDPTVIATLGILLLVDRIRWLLLPIPIIWCLISSATLWTMGASEFWMTLCAAGVALFAVRPVHKKPDSVY